MASEKVLEAKKARVAELTQMIEKSVSCVLVDYKGISVADDTKLRRELREAGVYYVVEKNSALRFALTAAGHASLAQHLDGTTAIALSENDQTAPARILGKYSENLKEVFNLKAGYVEGENFDAAGILALSKIPSKDVLLSQLVGSLQGPIQKLAATLQAVVDNQTEAA